MATYDRMRVVALVPAIQRAVKALDGCRYACGTAAKRFARDVQSMKGLTPGQERFLWQLVYSYRRQIPDAQLINLAQKKCEQLNPHPQKAE